MTRFVCIMKVLNKELSQKLEVQTQRLELLTSQSMVSDNVPQRKPGPRVVVDNTPYADEGDEVQKTAFLSLYIASYF